MTASGRRSSCRKLSITNQQGQYFIGSSHIGNQLNNVAQRGPLRDAQMRVIALIEQPEVIRHILEHFGLWDPRPRSPDPPPNHPPWPAGATIPVTYHPLPDIA